MDQAACGRVGGSSGGRGIVAKVTRAFSRFRPPDVGYFFRKRVRYLGIPLLLALLLLTLPVG